MSTNKYPLWKWDILSYDKEDFLVTLANSFQGTKNFNFSSKITFIIVVIFWSFYFAKVYKRKEQTMQNINLKLNLKYTRSLSKKKTLDVREIETILYEKIALLAFSIWSSHFLALSNTFLFITKWIYWHDSCVFNKFIADVFIYIKI